MIRWYGVRDGYMPAHLENVPGTLAYQRRVSRERTETTRRFWVTQIPVWLALAVSIIALIRTF